MSVEIHKTEDVWTIVHNRPEARNACDPEASRALHAAFLQFEDSSAKVAVFTGAGGHFCAGWDLKYAASLSDPGMAEAAFAQWDLTPETPPNSCAPMGPSRLMLSKPVIAAIEGAAVAGGMELALWADMRVMAETAYMGVYCRRWGISLMDGGTVRLPRLVGQGRAMEIALTGRKVEAAECLSIGLCERVVPHGEARAAAEALAAEIARFPQGAVRADRRSIYATQGMSVSEGLETEWAHGLDAIRDEGTTGAGRFRDGAGRSGDFSGI